MSETLRNVIAKAMTRFVLVGRVGNTPPEKLKLMIVSTAHRGSSYKD